MGLTHSQWMVAMGTTPHYTQDDRAAQPWEPDGRPVSPATTAPPTDLPTLLAAVRRRWGTHALRPLSQVTPPRRLTTGRPTLDAALRGGWPTGRLIVLHSQLTSGATTLALAGLRAAQTPGQVVVVLDSLQRFDPAAAVAGGLILDDLCLLRPDSSAEAFAMAAWLAQAGGVGGVVWLGAAAGAAGWGRLAGLLAHTPAVWLALTYAPLPPGSPLAHSAAVQATVTRQAWLRRRGDVTGARAQLSGADGQTWGAATLDWAAV